MSDTPKTDAFVMREYGERPGKPLTASECLQFARLMECEARVLRAALIGVRGMAEIEAMSGSAAWRKAIGVIDEAIATAQAPR